MYVHSVTALTGFRSVRTLREGSVVSVRIVAQSGPDQFKAAVGGIVIQLHSDLKLQPGQVFKASVSFRGEKLVLTPQQQPEQTGPLVQNLQFDQGTPAGSPAFVPVSDPALAAYLESLHLYPDSLSLRMIQQLRQADARFDAALLNKIRKLVRKFPGQEHRAAEAALVLESEGVECTAEAVAAMLALLDGQIQGDAGGEGESGHDGIPDDDRLEQAVQHAVRAYAAGIFSAADSQTDGRSDGCVVPAAGADGAETAAAPAADADADECSVPAVPSGRGAGLLTLLNHLGGKKHWVLLPFELMLHGRSGSMSGADKADAADIGAEASAAGHGMLRFCTDTERKTCEKIVLSMELNGQKSYYVIYLNNNGARQTVDRVYVRVEPEPAGRDAFLQAAKAALLPGADGCPVYWLQREECTPFFTENLPVSVVQGEV